MGDYNLLWRDPELGEVRASYDTQDEALKQAASDKLSVPHREIVAVERLDAEGYASVVSDTTAIAQAASDLANETSIAVPPEVKSILEADQKARLR